MTEEESVTDLVRAAARGDSRAWDSIVERFGPLVWSICMRCRLDRADAADVSQNVWLRLTEQLESIREPAALPGWLVTTTRRECLRFMGHPRDVLTGTDAELADDAGRTDPAGPVLAAERHDALLSALGELPDKARALMLMLIEDPPPSYQEISRVLQIPIGSIGPTRARHLERLRRSPALAGFVTTSVGGQS